jgi:chromosome segregation ATPase
MYEEPRPAALAQLMDHLKSLEEHLKKRLDGETPSPIAVDSVMGEGHQRLHELDAAHSKTMVDLKHHIEEGDGAQADHSSLRMEQQGATEKACALDEKVRALKEKTRAFEEEARAAWAYQKELLNKESTLLKHMQFCQGHAKTLGARLEQLEECREDLKARLEKVGQLEDPVSEGIKLILKYFFPEEV